jgi:hypothetical protein
MIRELREWRVIRDLSDRLCRRISHRVIRSLRQITDARLSGDNSCLTNAWEEVCIQVQGEQSYFWNAYEATIDQLIQPALEKLTDYEREAIWLQTPEGENWDDDDPLNGGGYPVDADGIVEYIKTEYIYHAAEDWTNRRIRKYLQS